MTKQAEAGHPKAPWTTDDIRSHIEKSRVVVFAKGTAEHPRCGFSERVFGAMQESGQTYDCIDVSQDRSILPALRAFTGRPQFLPIVYVDGEIVSSSETLEGMIQSGELQKKLTQVKLQTA